jgi:integrase
MKSTAQPVKNGKHQQWISTLESYAFPAFGDRPVNEIEGPAIRDVLAPIRIATVLDWACAKGFRATEAPMRSIAKGLPRQPKKDRHFAAMPYADVPAFIEKLRETEPVGRVALEALILTAARSGEMRGACWSESDLENRIWSVPAQRMGRTHLLPLSDAAVAVFERAKTFKVGASDLVFPGQNVRRPLSDMTLLKILRDMEPASRFLG